MLSTDILHRSPKRKRGAEPLSPRINTGGLGFAHETTDSDDGQSPRTYVTSRFQGLGLCQPQDSILQSGPVLDHRQPASFEFKIATSSAESPQSKGYEMFTFKAGATPTSSPPGKPVETVKSPPPQGVNSDQFWSADEITGWDPDDPDEDNYGVNGVGYQKTPAIAWSLSQKRKQQIAEYRNRETREARQKRGERRRGGGGGNINTSGLRSTRKSSDDEEEDRKTIRVRFDDG